MKKQGLKIEVKCNLKVVDYLDITFNLNDGTYKPINKPNNNPRYVHVESNHPPNIIKQIPKSISKRISVNSCSEAAFNTAAPYYNEILKNCGYSESLSYTTEDDDNRDDNKDSADQSMNSPATSGTRRKRQRNVIWFNPPYDKTVETKVGRIFLGLIDKHFGRNHRYHKIFNRNTIKVSYSCMDSMDKLIKQHNIKVTRKEKAVTRTCNCPVKEDCPLSNKCLLPNIVYRADVRYQQNNRDKHKVYIGVTEPPWKERYGVHKHSFRYKNTKNGTKLSDFVWELKDQGIADYNISWSILKRVPGYNRVSKSCGLCLT